MNKLILLTLLLFSVPALAESVKVGVPNELIDQINTNGAKEVLGHLLRDSDSFDFVCDNIESGTLEWLDVARLLKPAADAASSLALNYAVARVLPNYPERVLALVGRGFSVRDVCTSPFIEPDPGVAEAYEKGALTALSTVKSADLLKVRNECASRIQLPPYSG